MFALAIQFVAFVAISLALHLAVKSLARLLPREEHVDTSDWPPEMIAAVARRANRWGTLAALAAFVVLLPGWIAAAYWLDFRLLPTLAAGEIIVVPLHWGRWLRGAAAAYILAAIVALVVMRAAFGWRYDLVMAAGNRAFGFQASSLFYWALVWTMPFAIEYELHSLGVCVHLAARSLDVHEAFYLPPRRHDYGNVASLELARPYPLAMRTEIGRSPECRIAFGDDYAFTDVPWPFGWAAGGGPSDPEAIVNFVSRQSGRPVKIVPRIE